MMGNESLEIKIVGVDKEAIKTSSDNKDYWVVAFNLSSKPDQYWERNFYEVQQKDKNPLKRKSQIIANAISTEILATDDLQKVLDVIKAQVAETNALCEADCQRKIKIHQELETLQQKQRDFTQKFKEDSDKLAF